MGTSLTDYEYSTISMSNAPHFKTLLNFILPTLTKIHNEHKINQVSIQKELKTRYISMVHGGRILITAGPPHSPWESKPGPDRMGNYPRNSMAVIKLYGVNKGVKV